MNWSAGAKAFVPFQPGFYADIHLEHLKQKCLQIWQVIEIEVLDVGNGVWSMKRTCFAQRHTVVVFEFLFYILGCRSRSQLQTIGCRIHLGQKTSVDNLWVDKIINTSTSGNSPDMHLLSKRILTIEQSWVWHMIVKQSSKECSRNAFLDLLISGPLMNQESKCSSIYAQAPSI